LIDASGHGISPLLEAILQYFPLDTYVFNPALLMDLVNSDKQKKMEVPVWAEYQKLCDAAEGREIVFNKLERFEFYERAKGAFAIVATGETTPYGNIILKKGVVMDQ
jgi:L-fucose mutarotase